MNYKDLLNRYPIISDQVDREGLSIVLRELQSVLAEPVPGDIAEFGCYIGTTSLFIRRLLDEQQASATRYFYAYDSFAGLPDKTTPDESSAGSNFQGGALRVSKHDFLRTFHKAALLPPITYKTWFGEITAAQLPNTLAFAFLDGDFYRSIIDSLQLVWPRLQAQGILVIDDYQREALPGVTTAVRDFFEGVPDGLRYEHNIAIIKKP